MPTSIPASSLRPAAVGWSRRLSYPLQPGRGLGQAPEVSNLKAEETPGSVPDQHPEAPVDQTPAMPLILNVPESPRQRSSFRHRRRAGDPSSALRVDDARAVARNLASTRRAG